MPDRIALPPKAQTKPQNHVFHHQIIISTHTYLSALFREILTTFDRQGTAGAPGRCNMQSPSGIPTTLEVVAGMPPCLGRGGAKFSAPAAISSPKTVQWHGLQPSRGSMDWGGGRAAQGFLEPRHLARSWNSLSLSTATVTHPGPCKARCPRRCRGCLDEPLIVTKNSRCLITLKTLVPCSLRQHFLIKAAFLSRVLKIKYNIKEN